MFVSYCIAPRCDGEAAPGTTFCTKHDQAPPTQKGGWLSADKRRRETVAIDASQVAPRLWVGARPPVDRDLPKIDMLVLCAQEIQPTQLAFHGRVVRCPLPDDQITRQQLRLALGASRLVGQALVDKRRILVTCAMGLNRSAFVAALALGRVTTMSADDLVDLIRRRRDTQCLSNTHFVAHLQALVGAGRARVVGNDRKKRPR